MNDGAILIAPGSIDVSLTVKLYSATTGALYSVDDVTKLNLRYIRAELDNDYAVSGLINLDALANLTDSHSENRIMEITDATGHYRLDIPDAAVAKGVTGGSFIITHDDDVILPATIEWQVDPFSSLLLCTKIATVTSQTIFTLWDCHNDNDLYNGAVVIFYDVSSGYYPSIRRVVDYTGAGTLTIDAAPDFTVDTTDIVKIFASGVKPNEVNAEVDTALSNYDGPTKAEMDTAHALLATAEALTTHDGKLDTVDGIVDTIKTAVDFLENVTEGDVLIDTTTTPWNLVIKVKGTDTELIRKELKDVTGNNLASINTIIGRINEP